MDSNAEKEGQGDASMKRKKSEKTVSVKQEPVESEDEDFEEEDNDDDNDEEEEEDDDDDEEEEEEEDDDDEDDEEEEEEDRDDNDNALVTVRMDRNILDCPVCHKPLKSSLFQCPYGHVACSQCLIKLNRKCKTCSFRTRHMRSTCELAQLLAVEYKLKSFKISCHNSKLGCEKIFACAERDAHERTCQHAPCYHPMSNCTFGGPVTKVCSHYRSKSRPELWYLQCYNSSTTIYLPQDEPFHVINGDDGCLFLLLNSRSVASGNSLSLACIRPSSYVWDLEYELRVPGALYLKGSPIDITKWDGVYPDEHSLFVPGTQIGLLGVMKVNVKIRKIKPVAED